MAEREPICGFCWARLNNRQPLEFQPGHGWWECPVCKTKSQRPDPDEDELRARLARDYDPDPDRWRKTISSTLRIKGSGSKSGRKRKKPPKRQYEKPGTLA
jgi:hypothetical protein